MKNLDNTKFQVTGHVKIVDMTTGAVIQEVDNAINPETLSIVVANMLAGNNSQYIFELHLGNGGIIIDGTGHVTYKDVTENLALGQVAELYSPLYYKVVDLNAQNDNDDPTRNYISVSHNDGLPYTDIIITCTLEENQPENQSNPGEIIFNEMGLKSKGATGLNSGLLLSHVVFTPVTKNATRAIQIVYTLRIRL